MTILAARDGSVWVGYVNGEVAQFGKSRVEVFGPTSGLSTLDVLYLLEGHSGQVYVETRDGLRHREGGRWVLGAPQFANSIVFIDSASAFWGVHGDRNVWLVQGSSQVSSMHTPGCTIGEIREASDKALWALTRNLPATYGEVARGCALRRLRMPRHPGGQLRVSIPCTSSTGENMQIDADGSTWIASRDGALHLQLNRSASGPQRENPALAAWSVERHGARQGLTSDLPRVVLRDIFGDTWFGSDAGLDRFTPPDLRKRDAVPIRQPLLATGTKGHLWVASWDRPLRLIDDGEDTVHGPAEQWSSLYGARDGRLWGASYPLGFGLRSRALELFRGFHYHRRALSMECRRSAKIIQVCLCPLMACGGISMAPGFRSIRANCPPSAQTL